MWNVKLKSVKKWDIAEKDESGMWEVGSKAVAKQAPVIITVSTPKTRRTPDPQEPLAFCEKCQEWVPMKWRPVKERGKRMETWFECEFCGCRQLTFRYLSMSEAIKKNKSCKQSHLEKRSCAELLNVPF